MAISPMLSVNACDELRRLIHKTHLSYLNRDDTPDKLDQKTKLEALILEYLSIVSNDYKFCHAEVADCLTESVTRNPSFSAYKAAVAFEVIEKFAVNLLTKPWRKEFHVICPYSGFYKHTVEKQLFGSEYLLYLMGYKREHFPHSVINITDAPLDPDRLASIALDCLIAFVECQIMIQVYDVLKRKGYHVSWSEIYEIRSKYICGMDDVIRFIIEMKRNFKLIDFEDYMPALSSKYTHVCRGNYAPNSCWPIQEQPSVSRKNVSYMSENELCLRNDNLSRTDSYDLMHFPVESMHLQNTGGNYSNTPMIPYLTPPPPPMFAASYDDDDVTCISSSLSKPSKVNKGIQAGSSLDTLDASLGQLNLKTDSFHGTDTSQYCDPQIVITKNETLKPTKKTSKISENPVDIIDVSGVDLKNRTLEKLPKKIDAKKPSVIAVSSKSESNKVKSGKGTGVLKGNHGTAKIALPANSECGTKSGLKAVEPSWSCFSCTFINYSQRDVCEMCSRSKERGPENVPLVSGGKECPRCTLVNDKSIDYCTACETNLIDSPTYI